MRQHPRLPEPGYYGAVVVHGRVVPVVERLGRIDLTALQREIEGTGAEQSFWGMLAAQARREANDRRLSAEIIEAGLARKARSDLDARGVKITEDAVRQEVRLAPEYRRAREAQFAAEENADVAESVKFSIAQKFRVIEKLVGPLLSERRLDDIIRGEREGR